MTEKEVLNACDWLLTNAGPSIRYRTLTEILGKDINDIIVQETYKEILRSKRVEFIFSQQNDNGSFGQKSYHYGSNSGETYIRELLELGVSPKHELLRKGIEYVKLLHTSNKEDTSWIIGLYLEPIGRCEESELVIEWIKEYSEKFKGLYNNHRMDWLINKKGKPATCFLEIPFMYVIRTISNSWWWLKEKKNLIVPQILDFLLSDMKEVKDLYWIAPSKQLYAYSNFLYVVTSSYFTNNNPSAMDFAMALEGLWLLSEFGIVDDFTNLKNAFDFISSKKNEDGLWEFPISGITKEKSTWHSYHGFSLEENWRRAEAKIAELTFRICLVSHRNSKAKGSVKLLV